MKEIISKLKQIAKEHPLYKQVIKTNGKIVIGRGQQRNPEVLFIGEAPGKTENKTGIPFVGRSGKILDAWANSTGKTFAIINALPIIPLENEKIRKPTSEEINYFRPTILELIKKINPKHIVCVGKTSAECLEKEFINTEWDGNVGFIYHPAYYLRNGSDGKEDFNLLMKKIETSEFVKELSYDSSYEVSIQDFSEKIGVEIKDEEFVYKGKKWMIDKHPYDHSDDIIIEENQAKKYDYFLLVKTGGARTRIVGWCTQEQLTSTPARDIYRIGKKHHVVHDLNVTNLSFFQISESKKLLDEFVINSQIADNLGHTEMINGILAGLHSFCKKAGIYFRDINQKDECIISDKKIKLYTRDHLSDEDMLVYDEYFQKHPEITHYVCVKIKAGTYRYLGYVTKEVVEQTRVVNMIGADSNKASKNIRRIFAEQYKPLSDWLKIWIEDDDKEEEITPQPYIPLHMHSEFSVGDGYGKISYIADVLKKKGFAGAALTDHGSMAGVWTFQKELLARGMKPIIGCELYVKDDLIQGRTHLTCLVKNETGWKNLLKIHSIAVRDNFYYKPIVPFNVLIENSEGLIVTTGCSSSIFSKLIKNDLPDEAEKKLLELKSAFGDDLYVEMQPHNIENNQKVLQKLYEMAKKYSIKPVIATDSHYPKKEDKKYHEAVKAIEFKKPYGTAGYSDDIFYLTTEDEMPEILKSRNGEWQIPLLKEMYNNTKEVMDKCNFTIQPPEEDDTLPKLEFPKGRKEKLRNDCIAGLDKIGYKYEGKIKERLDLEVDRMTSKNYENYFLIVSDLINWAKKNGIACGPGRGSVGASLAAYCLNITDCDPMEHNLLFDRFLSSIRRDMPDCDMDFQDNRRHEVFDYFQKTYGKDHCAKVVTYARYHPKGVLRDMGRIFDIPLSEINKICSMVIVRSGGDARSSFGLMDTFAEFKEAQEFQKKYPEASEIAVVLEGHIRHRGVHAAAMVVSEKDISSYVPIGKVGGEIVTEWEKQLVEDMKLVKFDVLGLKTLTVIQDTVKMSDCELPKTFDDPVIYEKVFRTGKTLGVFQFTSVGMSKFVEQVSPDNFQELYDATTLFRPGALHSGQAMVYVNRKHNREPTVPFHPLLEPITKDTKHIILYQEQIMQIMNQVGGMSWATAEMARKVITKSKGKDALNKMRNEFVINANKMHSMAKEEAEKLYDVVSTFGSYGFNKAHAVEYSMLSYYCAWLKTYHPLEFYTALLKYETEKGIILDIINEAKEKNINFEYPEINVSSTSYKVHENKIYAGFDSINGVGDAVAKKIIKGQPYKDIDDFKKRTKIADKIFEKLVIADAFRNFNVNKKELVTGERQGKDYEDIEHMKLILQHTNLPPKSNIREIFDFGDYSFFDVGNLTEENGGQCLLLRGLVTDIINKDKLLRTDIANHKHRFEKHMIYLNLNDGTGNIAVQLNPLNYEQHKDILEKLKDKPIIVYGLISADGKKMYVSLISVVGEDDKIGKMHLDMKTCKENEGVIVSSIPAVSKNGNSYYRLKLHNGVEGLCFGAPEKLFNGLKVKYFITKKPFMNVKVISSLIKKN